MKRSSGGNVACASVDAVAAPVLLTAGRIAEIVGGRLLAGAADTPVGGFSIDSRRIAPGQLFIALPGERFDGAAFAPAALAAGACGVLVRHDAAAIADVPSGAFVIAVDDALEALQVLGRDVRRASGATVVAITGSAGKTSTKEIAAEFLGERYTVYRNPGNLNNHIGLPLSLLDLRTGPEMAVVELGMNHPGEIRRLVELAEPDVRLWTNVGDAHLGHFASVDEIADAKAEILELSTAKTRLVANADDARVMARARSFPGRVTTFGLGERATVRARDIEERGVRGIAAQVDTPAGNGRLETPLAGRGQLMNVLAATALALDFDVPLQAVLARAARLKPAPRRGELIALRRNVTLVDDSYNASPAAMAQALDALSRERPQGRRVAVLGEMRELGAFSAALHSETGRRAAAAEVELLVAVGGAPAKALAEAAIAAGLPADRVRVFETSDEAAPHVAAAIGPGDVVLVKGSRGTRTDVIADRVRAEWA